MGQTVQPLKKRFDQHASCDKYPIGRAIQKHGRKNFYYGVIKSCATKEELDEIEKHFIAVLHCQSPYGYNLAEGGQNAGSAEERARISKALTGRKDPKVRCVETGVIFESVSAAAKFFNTEPTRISRVCRGVRQTHHGYHFEFVKD